MTKRDNDWQRFEDYLAEELHEIAPNAVHTKGSRYGDIKNVPGLHVEAKCYDKKNVYNEDWMTKCISEIPLHSNKIGVLITKNKTNDIRVHMSWLDFKELYFEYYKLKFGGQNG